MEIISDCISLALAFLIPGGLLVLLIWIIYRRIKGKSWYGSGTSFVAENIYMQLETKENKASVEEMVYERDDKKEVSDSGDPFVPGYETDDSEKEK